MQSRTPPRARWAISLILALTAGPAPAQSPQWHFEFSSGSPSKIVWQTQAGWNYDLFYSVDLSTWTHVDGYPQQGNGGTMEYPFTPGAKGFFKISSEAGAPEFTLIAAGSFYMGDQSSALLGFANERPVHLVQLSAFKMATHEVTKALWDQVAGWAAANGYDINQAGASGKAPDHPVYSVTWVDCVKWCNARSEMDNLTPCYYNVSTTIYKTGSDAPVCDWTRNGYRLPTEAEWEKAGRGGSAGLNYPWGNTIIHSQANYWSSVLFSYDISPTRGWHPTYYTSSTPYTSPAGSFAANGFGLCDITGNVSEWCWDCFGTYSSYAQTDPHGPWSTTRVIRGGSWNDDARFNRVSYRGSSGPTLSYNTVGFRLARSAVP